RRQHAVDVGVPRERQRCLRVRDINRLEMVGVGPSDSGRRPVRRPRFDTQAPGVSEVFELPESGAEDQKAFAGHLWIALGWRISSGEMGARRHHVANAPLIWSHVQGSFSRFDLASTHRFSARKPISLAAWAVSEANKAEIGK